MKQTRQGPGPVWLHWSTVLRPLGSQYCPLTRVSLMTDLRARITSWNSGDSYRSPHVTPGLTPVASALAVQFPNHSLLESSAEGHLADGHRDGVIRGLTCKARRATLRVRLEDRQALAFLSDRAEQGPLSATFECCLNLHFASSVLLGRAASQSIRLRNRRDEAGDAPAFAVENRDGRDPRLITQLGMGAMMSKG